MKYFSSFLDAFALCDAIASQPRIEILSLVNSSPGINLTELAVKMHMTNGAITQHVKKLESAGLVTLKVSHGKRGKIKKCYPVNERVIIDRENSSHENFELHAVTLPKWLSVYVKDNSIDVSTVLTDALKQQINK